MSNLKEKVFTTINERHIEPKPRWQFLVRDWMVWVVAGVSLVVGAIATSLIIFELVNHEQTTNALLKAIPIVWVGVLAVFLWAVYYNVKHTRKGYQYYAWVVFLCSVLVSIVLGIGLYVSRASSVVDTALGDQIVGYESVSDRTKNYWTQPEKGRLAGEILKIKDNNDFTLRDFEGKKWTILGVALEKQDLTIIELSDQVRVLGTQASDNVFVACAVIPWDIRGEREPVLGLVQQALREANIDLNIFPRTIHNERNIKQLRNSKCAG